MKFNTGKQELFIGKVNRAMNGHRNRNDNFHLNVVFFPSLFFFSMKFADLCNKSFHLKKVSDLAVNANK